MDSCENCGKKIHKWEYRLMYGSSWEGLSIREVYYDKDNKIVGWSRQPILTLTDTAQDIKTEIVQVFKDLDNMLEATNKPVLNELELEEKLEK